MTALGWIGTGLLLLGLEFVYLRLARRFRIVDLPNDRSMHTDQAIVRGGGIICWVAAIGIFAYSGFSRSWFFLGLMLVAGVSFRDDVRHVPSWQRLLVQTLAITLLLYQNKLSVLESNMAVIALLMGIGMLNAYNFMDGVNGMTALYGLLTLGTLTYLNWTKSADTYFLLLGAEMLALLVFAGFNVRRQAICFAGDVGSITLAFIVLQGLLTAVVDCRSFMPVLLLAVYGVDTTLTILQRLYLRHRIALPHRMHLFQELVHKGGWSHLQVSGTYTFVQLVLNVLLLTMLGEPRQVQWLVAGLILTGLAFIYVGAKWRLGYVAAQKSRFHVQEAAL